MKGELMGATRAKASAPRTSAKIVRVYTGKHAAAVRAALVVHGK